MNCGPTASCALEAAPGMTCTIGPDQTVEGAGILRAREIIESGAARAKLDEFVRFTQQFRSGR